MLALRRSHSPWLTQEAFAKLYGFSPGAVRDWDQGRRQPGRSARILWS